HPGLAEFLAGAADTPVGRRPQPSDLAVQLYTSGTTGKPKGAMLTQGSFAVHLGNMARADVAWNRWSDDDVSYLSMPISHIGGTGWGIWGVFYGSRTIIERQFEIDAVFDRIELDRVTKMFVVPAAMQMMVRHPRARSIDYSSIRTMNYGASPISPALLRECVEVFGCGFTQMYGMTETIGTVVALPPEDHLDLDSPRLRAAGLPLPAVELAIFDADGGRLPAGEIGEVAIRSVAQMEGYWQLPAETARTIDADGWLHTGDAGYLDQDGYLYIHDRIKDMIVTGAENVYSVEVEAVLSDYPAVAEVAVIGIPNETWGEEVAAFVVLRPGMDSTPEQLTGFARERLAGFKVPRSYHFVGELPRNPSGKVVKKTLRAPFWEGRDRQVS
ncbi:MAG: acyl-CoA synthetase, partial [Hoeflea sp. BRH_c9]